MRLVLAILLSLLVPGTGQFVNRQRWKGILFVGLDLVCILLKYTVSLIPMYVLYVVVLVDVVVVGIQIIQGKREKPTGKPYVIEVIVAFLIAVIVTWVVDWGTEELTKVTLGDTTMSEGLSKKEEQQVKQEAEKYLKDKYGKDFEVDQIKFIWQTGTYTMKGHLKGEKNSSFLIRKKKEEYTDAYFLHKLSDEGKEEIKPHLESAFTSLMNWDSTVTVAEQEEERFAGQNITYAELRQQTDRYQQQVKVNVPIALSASNKAAEMEKAYQLIEHLNQNGIEASLQVHYYNPSLLKKGVRKVDFTKQVQYGDYVTAYLEVDDVSQVSSSEDLETYLEIY